jgi:hypothetical protein
MRNGRAVMLKFLTVIALARQLEILVRGRRERSERGGRSHIILNYILSPPFLDEPSMPPRFKIRPA